jgi:hypothetical protein
VAEAIERDLATAGGGGDLTRLLCARALQYEIFRQELPVLLDQTAKDADLGSAGTPVGLEQGESLRPAIETLQDPHGPSLPQRLGRDSSEEASSTLAMRTISHAALVGLGALPGLSVPMARAATPARVPFLTISGMMARGRLVQTAVVMAFVASSVYLAARSISAARHQVLGQRAELGSVASPSVWVMWIAALVVAACVAVPLWRARSASTPTHASIQIVEAVFLLAVGGLVPIVGGIATLGVAKTVVATNAFAPNGWVLAAVLAAAGIISVATRRLGAIGKPLAAIGDRVFERSQVVALLAIVASALLIVDATRDVWDDLGTSPWWNIPSIVAACLSAPLALAYVFGQTRIAARLGRPGRRAG